MAFWPHILQIANDDVDDDEGMCQVKLIDTQQRQLRALFLLFELFWVIEKEEEKRELIMLILNPSKNGKEKIVKNWGF